MQEILESRLLTRKEAAQYLNISVSTLDRNCTDLPKIKLFGKTVMFEKEVLDQEIEKWRVK